MTKFFSLFGLECDKKYFENKAEFKGVWFMSRHWSRIKTLRKACPFDILKQKLRGKSQSSWKNLIPQPMNSIHRNSKYILFDNSMVKTACFFPKSNHLSFFFKNSYYPKKPNSKRLEYFLKKHAKNGNFSASPSLSYIAEIMSKRKPTLKCSILSSL